MLIESIKKNDIMENYKMDKIPEEDPCTPHPF